MIQKTADVLYYLSENLQGATLTEIAAALGFPRTTVFDILKTLMANDFVHYIDGAKKLYGIGSAVYTIGMAYLDSSRLFIIAKPYLILLADKYEKTTFISKRHDDRFTFVYKYDSPYAKIATSNIGDKKMLHSTSIGKCFLAFDASAEPLIETIELVPFTKYTITSRETLKAHLEEIRSLGYSYEFQESNEHIACLAAPIYTNARMIGTISMTGLHNEDEDFASQGNELAQIAKVISGQLAQNISHSPEFVYTESVTPVFLDR
jgi:DNA-binding IclR family transcriptional regulator